jgi:hypothetical protein
MRVLSVSLVGFALGILAIVGGAQQSVSYRSLSLGEAIGVKGGQSCTSGCCNLNPVQTCDGGTDVYCEADGQCGGGWPEMGIPPYCSPETPLSVVYFGGSWRTCNDNQTQGKVCESLGEVPCEVHFSCLNECIMLEGAWHCETDLSSAQPVPGEENNQLVGGTHYCA